MGNTVAAPVLVRSELQNAREAVAQQKAVIEAHYEKFRLLAADLRMNQSALDSSRDPGEAARLRAVIPAQEAELQKRRGERAEMDRDLQALEREVTETEAEVEWIRAFLAERSRVRAQYQKELARWSDAVQSEDAAMKAKQDRLHRLTGGMA